MASCPACEAVIDMGDEEFEEGQTVECPDCGAELEVVNTNPLELDILQEEEEEEEEEAW
jgi:alpha-aminoadipate carrier protein LysW